MSNPCINGMDTSQLAYPLFDPVNYSPADSSPFSVAFNFDNRESAPTVPDPRRTVPLAYGACSRGGSRAYLPSVHVG